VSISCTNSFTISVVVLVVCISAVIPVEW
jgi:hypothetical protein